MGFAENDEIWQAYLSTFRQALQNLGWTDGGNIRFDYRFSGESEERMRRMVWNDIMAINLTPDAILASTNSVVSADTERPGALRIVNIVFGSRAPIRLGSGFVIAYAVSKAGLIHLTRCMAVALAPETLVNCVAPGLLDGTRATANLKSEQIERSAAASLLKKPADKDDCADMVVTMCRTQTMTGQTVVIDSGRIFH